MDNERYVCPECGSENTASVPLVYKNGHTTGISTKVEIIGHTIETKVTTYSDGHKDSEEIGNTPIYGNVTRPINATTDLARELAPPPEPEMPVIEEAGFFIHVIATIISFVGAFKITNMVIFLMNWESTGFGEFLRNLVLGGISTLILSIFLWVALVEGLWPSISGAKRRHEEAMMKYYEDLKQHRKKYESWEKLYVCLRCGHRFHLPE